MSSDERKIRRRVGKLIQKSDSLDERSEASSRGSKASSSGEVVLGDELQGVCGQLGERRVSGLESGTAGSKLAEASLGSGARDVGGLSVESEAVAIGEGARARGCCEGSEIGLREGYGEGAVGREVELSIALSPVSVSY